MKGPSSALQPVAIPNLTLSILPHVPDTIVNNN
jgi:hypothetical protein